MTRSFSPGVFLSYRREDSAPYARLLQIELRDRLPGLPVFLDMDSIEAGCDFSDVIRDAISASAVLVALIGPQWATLTDAGGRRRLDNPDDYVRFEIQMALEQDVRVIPVLVDGARPPQPQQLPAVLRGLARLNALELSNGRYQYDAARLVDLITGVLATASAAGSSTDSGTRYRWRNREYDLGRPLRDVWLHGSVGELLARARQKEVTRAREPQVPGIPQVFRLVLIVAKLACPLPGGADRGR